MRQWIELANLDLSRLGRDQRRAIRTRERQTIDACSARNRDGTRRSFLSYKRERKSCRERTVLELQSFRQLKVFGVARKRKRVEIERDRRFLRVGERRRGFARESKFCAVDCALESRGDVDLRIVGKARQKRDSDSEIR